MEQPPLLQSKSERLNVCEDFDTLLCFMKKHRDDLQILFQNREKYFRKKDFQDREDQYRNRGAMRKFEVETYTEEADNDLETLRKLSGEKDVHDACYKVIDLIEQMHTMKKWFVG